MAAAVLCHSPVVWNQICVFAVSVQASVSSFSVSSPLLSPTERAVWLWEQRVDITPQNTALHKDACLEREWRLLTFSTQDGKNEEEEEKEEEDSEGEGCVQGFLNSGDTFMPLLF